MFEIRSTYVIETGLICITEKISNTLRWFTRALPCLLYLHLFLKKLTVYMNLEVGLKHSRLDLLSSGNSELLLDYLN